MSEEKKNCLPLCNYCTGIDDKSEWIIVYGPDPEQDYMFACSDHLGKAVNSLKVLPSTFYVSHYSSQSFYNAQWSNKEWPEHFKRTKGE